MLLSVILILTSCNQSSPGSYDTSSSSSYQDTKLTLEEKEKQDPLSFLSTDGTYRENLVGQWVLEGTVTNHATIAKYKDVVLTVKFYSKTKTLLGSEKHSIYEYFSAGRTKSFKIKTFGYRGTKSIGWDISRASNAN